MKRQLSQTKSAIARRAMRRNETPRAKAKRLKHRRALMAAWRAWQRRCHTITPRLVLKGVAGLLGALLLFGTAPVYAQRVDLKDCLPATLATHWTIVKKINAHTYEIYDNRNQFHDDDIFPNAVLRTTKKTYARQGELVSITIRMLGYEEFEMSSGFTEKRIVWQECTPKAEK